MMDKDTQFAVLVIGLPLLGLLYCGLIIAFLMNNPFGRGHPLITGFMVMVVPFSVAATIWIKASAKAYKEHDMRNHSEAKKAHS
ncbi:hypothetical protein WH8501_28675 [Crocosphaera watsonii WH 8501]|uniref:Uncharacterized protein n=1 Tax=Crocosphaera watsonii WH 8501 TaxID=165597 RepID=Q4C4W7_CROWT|nr:hypothetical protein [Crocosphaera watsonii]EAM51146.1 hypothetical protein CwatDRAFT_4237 [Crocosphaera watsonii WH 8501]